MKAVYSQNNEEQFILEFFKGKLGTFLDIGANDGVTLSNTRAIALLGWKGVLVEPSPGAFLRLKDNYREMKGFYLYPFALSNTNMKKTFFESGPLINEVDISLVGTFFEEEKRRFPKVKYSPVEVQCFRWKTFVNRLSITEFDFVSIDIEGGELVLMPQMDFSCTALICVEWNSIEEKKKLFLDILSKYDLKKIIYTSAENLIISK